MFKKMSIRLVLMVGVMLIPAIVFASSITAGGSTAIYPVMSKWAKTYSEKTNIDINYQPVGSGGGIQGLTNSTFSFAASDMPLSSDQLSKNHWIQFPAVISGIVTVVNLPGFKANQISLNGSVLANIYLGTVKYWDDASIAMLNKGMTLPHTMIIPIHRADASGTTFNFTNYLSKVSADWSKAIGFNTQVSWPGISIGAKGNAGVAAQVQSIPGAIGYVEYSYALENKMTYMKLSNRSGASLVANAASFSAAAENADWKDSDAFDLILTNQQGQGSWPIVQTTFVLLPIGTDADTKTVVQFFRWCFVDGKDMATGLDYVPLPASVVSMIESAWKANGF